MHETEAPSDPAPSADAARADLLARLCGSVAHDFNNLLAVVCGHAELVRAELPPRHAGHASLDQILASVDRGAALTRQVLAISRRDPGEAGPFDLVALVRGMGEVVRCVLGSGRTLVLELPAAPLLVDGGPWDLEQALLELCAYAKDASGRGQRVTVRVAERAGNRADLYVDAEVPVSGAAEPLSFGHDRLPLAARCARTLGGELRVGPTATGLRASLRLPVRAPERREEGLRVLVAEDDDRFRDELVGLLHALGHEAVAANDGPAAIALADARAHDVLLTDVSMPRMTGGALAAALRARRPDLPVIYLSAGPRPVFADRWPEGVWRSKPLTSEGLRSALEETIRR